MKIKSLFVVVLLMAGVMIVPAAHASEKPVIDSFTFSPQQVDLQSTSTLVSFELVASHPNGIENQQILVTLTNDAQQIGINLFRSESPLNPKLAKVVFKGSINIPRDVVTGAYAIKVGTVKNGYTAGYQFESDEVKISDFRSTVGAENGLLVSSGDFVDLTYPTFAGPTYDNSTLGSFLNRSKYSGNTLPIWKVNENVDLNDFYEVQVPSLVLNVSSTTPEVCKAVGSKLSLISQGTCSYTVYTERDKIYAKNSDSRNVTITGARTKPAMTVQDLDPQDIKSFPTSITLAQVYASGTGWVLPQSITPRICSATGFVVKVLTAGTCMVTYQTQANSLFLASDLYTQKIEILKDGKPVVVPTPVPTPTPTPVATPTAKPVVKKIITCVKGKKTIKKTAISPKCPAGYKLKK